MNKQWLGEGINSTKTNHKAEKRRRGFAMFRLCTTPAPLFALDPHLTARRHKTSSSPISYQSFSTCCFCTADRTTACLRRFSSIFVFHCFPQRLLLFVLLFICSTWFFVAHGSCCIRKSMMQPQQLNNSSSTPTAKSCLQHTYTHTRAITYCSRKINKV